MRSRGAGQARRAFSLPRTLLRRWWLDRSVRSKGLIVVAVPLIALVATTTASLVLQYDERSERSVDIHAFALMTSGHQILTDALNAETGVRGYAAADFLPKPFDIHQLLSTIGRYLD